MPADTPDTTPVDEPTVAMPVLPLLHIPPVAASGKGMVEVVHTTAGPEIVPTDGEESTVTTVVA